jgi:hypothetical protein
MQKGTAAQAHPPRQNRLNEAENIAKVAAARKLLTCVFYAMRDGGSGPWPGRSRASPSTPASAAGSRPPSSTGPP